MSVLIDSEHREKAISELHTSFAVSAGAGAGKTSVLVERLVRVLAQGVGPDRIAAITFTEKAAGELLTRVRDALEAEHRAAPAPDGPVAAALGRFGELQISTIHGFCQRLLQREALAAAWAPDTAITGDQPEPELDALYAAWRRGFDRRHPEWVHLLREMAHDDAEWSSATLKGMAWAMLENRDLEPLCAGQEGVDWDGPWQAVLQIRQRLPALAAACRSPEGCKLLAKCRPLLAALARLSPALPARQGVLAALSIDPVSAGKLGAKKDWAEADKEAFLAEITAFGQWREGRWQAIGAVAHRLVIADLREHFLLQAQRSRLQRARADFADLLFRARALLADNAAARRRLAERYQVLLVDEVQDTDPLQAEVAALLARPLEAEGRWDQSPPRRGGLFAVGDPRQSIYRFRRADVDTWRRLQDLIRSDGETLSLRQNFRSVPGIIAWVNHAFSDYPGYEAQAGWREPGRLPPVVTLHADEADDAENAEIDACIRHLWGLLRGGAEVFDARERRWRAAQPRDVMLLLPSWTAADEIHERLTLAGIPAVIEGGSSFFEREEIRLLLEAMQAIEEPTDSAAVLCALRGLFGLSHADLARHRTRGGSWDYTSRPQPAGPAADALEALRGLHRSRQHRSWAPLLDDLLAQTGAAAVWALTPHRARALSNLDKLRALIRQVEPDTRAPSEVLGALRRMAETADLSTWDEEADAVRITTFFKAKGLEAPVVALLCASRRADSPSVVVDRGRRALALRAGRYVRPPGWEELEEGEKQELAAERRRWMYVAATRARDQLVVVLGRKSHLYAPDIARGLADAGAPHGATIALAPGAEVLSLRRAALPPAPYERATFPGLDSQVDALLSAPAAPAPAEERAGEADAAIAEAERRSTRWRSLERPRRQEAAGSEWAGPRWGLAAWRSLLRVDLGAPLEAAKAQLLQVLTEEAGLAGLDGEERQRAQEAAEGLLAHPAFAEARAAAVRLQDVPVLLQERDTVLSGRIDLCYPTDAERKSWRILDWKIPLQRASPSFLERYPGALGSLARKLLGTCTPCEHVEVVLLSPAAAAPPPAVPVEELLEDALPELVSLVRRLVASGNTPEIGFDVGEGRVYTQLELAWPDRRLGLGLRLPPGDRAKLEAEGWEVVHTQADHAGWADAVAPAVLALVGAPAEDGAEP